MTRMYAKLLKSSSSPSHDATTREHINNSLSH